MDWTSIIISIALSFLGPTITVIKEIVLSPITRTILCIYGFLIGYCAYLSIWEAWKKGLLPLAQKIIYAPFLLVFGAIDVVLNYTVGFLFFLEMPRRNEITLSLRARRYHDRIVENPNIFEKWRHFWGVCIAWLLNPPSQAIGEGDHI